MGWVWLIFISALSLLNLSLCLLFSGCLHLYPSFHRSVSVHLSLSVLSTEQQRFINVPAWFLAIPASSDLSLLEFIKKTLTLHCNLTGSLHHSYFFSPLNQSVSTSASLYVIFPSLWQKENNNTNTTSHLVITNTEKRLFHVFPSSSLVCSPRHLHFLVLSFSDFTSQPHSVSSRTRPWRYCCIMLFTFLSSN